MSVNCNMCENVCIYLLQVCAYCMLIIHMHLRKKLLLNCVYSSGKINEKDTGAGGGMAQ